jgi:hypothetical protein
MPKSNFLATQDLNRKFRRLSTAVGGGNASTSNILVTSSAGFQVGDLIRMTTAGTYHTVTAVPDGTHVTISPAMGSAPTTGNMECWGYCPVAVYVSLLTTIKGPRANSTAYALNDTLSLIANDGKTHLYKCTTAGTTAASQGALYPGVANEAITDGTAVMTEQDSGLRAGTAQVEVTGGAYARQQVTQLDANWNAPAGTPLAISNVNAVTFPTPTANWGNVWGFEYRDAVAAGNLLLFAGLNAPKTVNNGETPSFAAGQLGASEQ